MKDGAEGFVEFFKDFAVRNPVRDIEIVRGVLTAVMDLFRVSDGKIVEHWDVIEEIDPQKTWTNSGKF